MSFPYRRIAVIGCPGSGKSTLSRALREATGLPLYHLDAIYWRADRTTVPKEEFNAIQQRIIERDEWIIDGNYGSTLEWRIATADLVIFLDYPTEICLAGVRFRKGQPRSDIPWVEEGEDEEFLAFIRAFREESRPRILSLLHAYSHKAIMTFTARAEGDAFLRELKSGKQ